MTQRERFLAIVVGGLFFVVGAQWIFNQYRGALQFRQNRLASLNGDAETMQMKWLAGAEAERQMGEYKIRSLSSDQQVAQSSFQAWLLDTVREVGLKDAVVDPVGDIPIGDLYRRFGFRLAGKADLPGLVDLVYEIQARDQLHRIREMTFAPVQKSARRSRADNASDPEGDDLLSIVMVIDAISLSIADKDPPTPSEDPSWRIAQSKQAYRASILNRNFFKPPNQAPRYSGSEQLVAMVGQSNDLKFDFEDPEKHDFRLSLQGELPEWASWDEASGRLKVSPPKTVANAPAEGETASEEANSDDAVAEVESFEVEITAIDNGYPARESKQTVLVRMQQPPPPPKPTPPAPGFDDSTQTFLTALVQGREDWTAWMSVRTRGKTLQLKIGDEFEIGSIQGKVTGVTARSVTIEIDGMSYELKPAGKLSDVLHES